VNIENVKLAGRIATPDGYAEERLGLKLHPKQRAVLRDLFPLAGGAPKSRVSFRKANEVGGTRTVIAAAILYAMEIRQAEVISTAGKWQQVHTQLIPALRRFAPLFGRNWEFQDTGIKVNGSFRYIGFSTMSGFAQGFHRTEGRPLVGIIDEAGLVESGIFDDIEDRCNPDYFLCAGAPMEPAGRFYEFESRLHRFYVHHHVSQFDCLKEHGWWLDRKDIERKIAKYGSEEHPFIQSNVYGNFASKTENGLMSLKEFESCLANPPEWHPGIDNRHMFVDVGVNNIAALRHGNKITIQKRWTAGGSSEIDQIIGPIIRLATVLKQSIGLQVSEISVDGSGDYGKNVCDQLQEMGWRVNRFYGQGKDVGDADYYNRISEAWLGGSASIKSCDAIIPDDDNFRAQCLSRRQRVGGSGKLQVEPKDEYMKRGFESPHEGDAIFGAMLPVRGNQKVNLSGLNNETVERSWRERGMEERRQESNYGQVLPAESCL
jgi:hypothetical protein